MSRMLATFLLLLSLGAIMFNHAEASTLQQATCCSGTTSCVRCINDCSDVVQSGVYTITQPPNPAFQAYSEAYVEGGWTVILRRNDGSINFYRSWEAYVNGFGRWYGEFWLGLSKLHQLTKDGNWHLRVELADWDGSTAFAEYDAFSIGDAASNYTITIGGYSGDAGDSLDDHNGSPFTTFDKDNDRWDSGNCAKQMKGGWWYTECFNSHLTGQYGKGKSDGAMAWFHWKKYNCLKSATMMIRPMPTAAAPTNATTAATTAASTPGT